MRTRRLTSFERMLERLRSIKEPTEFVQRQLVRYDRALERKPGLIKKLWRRKKKAENKRDQRGVWWDVYSLDVWGNAEEGFEVNNRFHAGVIRAGQKKADIRRALVRESLLRDVPVHVEMLDDLVEISDPETGEPVFYLESRARGQHGRRRMR